MNNKIKFLVICILFSLFSIASVSANDNATSSLDDGHSLGMDAIKETPAISINASAVYTGQSIAVSLKDSNNNPIANQSIGISLKEFDEDFNQNFTDSSDGGDYSILTNNDGLANLELNLKSNNYILNVIFEGNDKFASVNETFDIDVLKLPTIITASNTTILQGKYLYMTLKDKFGNVLNNTEIYFSIGNSIYYRTTDENGTTSLQINLIGEKTYSIIVGFDGNDYYDFYYENFPIFVVATTSIEIGNSKLLTNGYLRIYLKSYTPSAIYKKSITVKIGSKIYKKKTNSEGILIFKPKLGTSNYLVEVSFKGSSSVVGCENSKKVKGVKGSVRNPLEQKVPWVNGKPNIDVMPINYAMANGDMTYTVTKTQYMEVIKRDSYCLYLNSKLSKYTFFKSKAEPKLNHVIMREKWNVIERALNEKLVEKNQKNYWPGAITVSLKGKSYTYSEVCDWQETDYTCGPAAGSVCSQVLRNYVCESYLAKLAGSKPVVGTSPYSLKVTLGKFFSCSYFYKSTFNYALNQLKKGGCALIFHAPNRFLL